MLKHLYFINLLIKNPVRLNNYFESSIFDFNLKIISLISNWVNQQIIERNESKVYFLHSY